LYVHVEGSLAMRPAMEGPDRRSLVVDRFVRSLPGVSCERPAPSAAFTNTYWRIESLEDRTLAGVPGRREPAIVFLDGAGPRFAASIGCNRLIGGYVREGSSLTFSPAASTMMACPPPLDTLEQALAKVLSDVRSVRTSGTALELRDEAGAVIARLTAVYGP